MNPEFGDKVIAALIDSRRGMIVNINLLRLFQMHTEEKRVKNEKILIHPYKRLLDKDNNRKNFSKIDKEFTVITEGKAQFTALLPQLIVHPTVEVLLVDTEMPNGANDIISCENSKDYDVLLLDPLLDCGFSFDVDDPELGQKTPLPKNDSISGYKISLKDFPNVKDLRLCNCRYDQSTNSHHWNEEKKKEEEKRRKEEKKREKRENTSLISCNISNTDKNNLRQQFKMSLTEK